MPLVTLTDAIDGTYVIEAQQPDGRVILQRADLSADAILQRAGARRLTQQEFDEQFGDLRTDEG